MPYFKIIFPENVLKLFFQFLEKLKYYTTLDNMTDFTELM